MDFKKIVLFTIILIIAVSTLSMVSAGLFGFGEIEKENATFYDDANNALFTATIDKGSYEKSHSYIGALEYGGEPDIDAPSIGYTCSYNDTELFVQCKPLTSYDFALDYYSDNSSYKVTEKDGSFIYDGTDSYGHNEWSVITSDGKQGIIEVSINEVKEFNDEDYNLIQEFINTINPDMPNSVTVEGMTLTTK